MTLRRALLPALALVAACGGPEPDAPAAAPAPAAAAADRHEQGRRIWNFRCYYCHGYSGDARTLAASFLDPAPRDFTTTAPDALPRPAMLETIRDGRPGTAMRGFAGILEPAEIEAVADFARAEFMNARAPNTRYHTAANGWPDHERYRIAYPFATGQLPLDTPWDALSEEQAAGKRLFLGTCISCHDRSRVEDEGVVWEKRALSYPRAGYSHQSPPVDAMASASPYAIHDRPPVIAGLSTVEREGERIYQANCAFCHAADGTGQNWIGTFLEPHPRNLTDPQAMAGMSRARLARTIREGLPGTSMPAWKHVLSAAEIDAVVAYVNRAFHPLADDSAAGAAASR